MSEIEELKKKISYLENENIVMYAALLEASKLEGVAALRCKVELQRIARQDADQPSGNYCNCFKNTPFRPILVCLVCHKQPPMILP